MGSTSARRVYFDHNATTYTRREVVEKMLPFFAERFGNASSVHFFGEEAQEAIEEARENVASLIGAEPEEILFTSGGTESDNLAIRGVVKALRTEGVAPHVITSKIEHPAVIRTCQALEKEGVEVTYVGVLKDGTVDLEELEGAIRPNTLLVSIMLANNETGVIQPIEKISRMAAERGITMHVDGVQGVGKIPVNVDDLGVDLLSVSAHKFYGPKGIGALYIRRGTRMDPIYTGGGHERGIRPGTENVPGIVGFGEAARITARELDGEMEQIGSLRNRLEQGIKSRVDAIVINGEEAKRVPNTSSVVVKGIEGEAMTLAMSLEGFAISSGSACSSGSGDPSHVLLAMGVDPKYAQGGIRISLGIINTEADIDGFLDVFPGVVERLRSMSPIAE